MTFVDEYHNRAETTGEASGWSVSAEDDEFRWTAYGPSGSQEGTATTRDEAIAQAREAMRHLGVIER